MEYMCRAIIICLWLFGAIRPLGLVPGFGQGWQQHCRQDGDDRDDNQQFEEREGGR